jgi:hypothetical protein
MKFVSERIKDQRLLDLISAGLKAKILLFY